MEMEYEVSLDVEIECEFCKGMTERGNLPLVVIRGANQYGYCPQCTGVVPEVLALSEEWRQKVDEYYAAIDEK